MRLILASAIAYMAVTSGVFAQERTPSHCHALASDTPGVSFVQKANWQTPPPPENVGIHYITHSSFLIQSARGLNMITDYTGFVGGTDMVPDVVTMNHAHSSHWTSNPDPRIPHVLPGWGEVFGSGIDHNVDLGEVLVRNVSTDIRSPFGGGVELDGNSIFVFEMAGLCIGHLGHLHHEPNDEQYAAIGRLDVVMAAVDGGTTVDLPTMMRIVSRLRSSIVIPMHWFSEFSLSTFLTAMEGEFQVVRVPGASLQVSMDRLPSRPTIMVLNPEWLLDSEIDD
ncbi:MAG: MBL fold metallo-hydrolase [Pseudomonadota bacterium]